MNWRRYEIYYGCLMSIKAWIDTFLSAPFELHTSMPYIIYPQMVHIFMGLHKMTILQDPAWDQDAMRQVIDLIPTLDKIIKTFDQLKATAALMPTTEENDDPYSWIAGIFVNMKMAWQNELTNVEPAIYQAVGTNGDENPVLPLNTEDMAWLSNMLDGPWGGGIY